MKKMSINDAAELFGVSKEAIHNRVRRGSLQTVTEDGVKLVLIEDAPHALASKTPTHKKSHSVDDRYYQLLEEQNKRLQERVEKLEDETRELRSQKEQMLIDEREKIELIYRQKDEQLKSILEAITTKFLPNLSAQKLSEVEHLDAELESDDESEEEQKSEPIEGKMISLKKYIKRYKLSKGESLRLQKALKEFVTIDRRAVLIGSKYYINSKLKPFNILH